MSQDPRDFLSRWARRKREATRESAEPKSQAPARQPGAPAKEEAELPSLESLTFESDFTGFLRANVEESVKRAALKKLFRDPRFNVMDGLDTYIDDYTKNDPISDEMLKQLDHARSTFLGLEPPAQEPQQANADEPGPDQPDREGKPLAGKDDGDTRQDT
jgi:Protein of unknown function (DUF3306)